MGGGSPREAPDDWMDWPPATGAAPRDDARLASGNAPVSPEIAANAEQIQLALRVLLLLSRIGRPSPDDIARPESTQQGIADTLHATQGAVSKVLQRLSAADVVRHTSLRVRGRTRRVRVYFVTVRGGDLAKRYREKHGDTVPPR